MEDGSPQIKTAAWVPIMIKRKTLEKPPHTLEKLQNTRARRKSQRLPEKGKLPTKARQLEGQKFPTTEKSEDNAVLPSKQQREIIAHLEFYTQLK